MDVMSIGEILDDFRSIKLSKEKRDFVDRCRVYLQKHGNLPVEMRGKLKAMAKAYSIQFTELHASRERARKTIWRKREGITIDEAHRLVRQRRDEVAKQKADVGL